VQSVLVLRPTETPEAQRGMSARDTVGVRFHDYIFELWRGDKRRAMATVGNRKQPFWLG